MAKAKEREARPETPPYRMPAVERGDVVLWHDGATADATAMALVSQVGGDSVTLAVLGEGYQNFLIRTGVRHRDHPDRKAVEATDAGVWSHRPGHLALLDRIAALEESATRAGGAAATLQP